MAEPFTSVDINTDVRVHFKRPDGEDVYVPGRLCALRRGATVIVMVHEHDFGPTKDWAILEVPVEDVERVLPRADLYRGDLVPASAWKP